MDVVVGASCTGDAKVVGRIEEVEDPPVEVELSPVETAEVQEAHDAEMRQPTTMAGQLLAALSLSIHIICASR
jgi:hypothetical protein